MNLERAKRTHKLFHGKPATVATPIAFEDPQELVILGRAVAIEYECDKINGAPKSVAGRKATYRHVLDKDDILATDQTRKKLYIIGPKLHVTARGIVN